MKSHKRKRSIQDDPVDVSKMKTAAMHLQTLKTELEGIEETEAEVSSIMKHVGALEQILNDAKKPRMSCSSVSEKELGFLGIPTNRLVFDSQALENLAKQPSDSDAHIPALVERLKNIYDHVNMDFEAGCRMLLDAVLLSVADISAVRSGATSAVAILPEMRLAVGEGVVVQNPESSHELWLTGQVDYAVMQFPNTSENKSSMLDAAGFRKAVLNIADGHIFLVEAKRQGASSNNPGLLDQIPEGIAQALIISERSRQRIVRFCLSDGCAWVFALLVKHEGGKRTAYVSNARYLARHDVQDPTPNLTTVKVIVELVLQWLSPTMDLEKLYRLETE